jgi:protein SCO1/2
MEMAALLGIRYKKLPDGEFAHSNVITLLNPEGEIVHQQIGLGQERTAASSDKLLAVLSGEA